MGTSNPNAAEDSILVTGGCGFIGTNFVFHALQKTPYRVLNLDKCTYAANPRNLEEVSHSGRYTLISADILDRTTIEELLTEYQPRAIVHFAAESHVDRSISRPEAFVDTNIVGTFRLLEASQRYWSQLNGAAKDRFRFLHVSTDEVYGSLGPNDQPFNESTPYQPNSPYSASKAASDHLVRSFHHTYGLPTLTTNCSNNYGPYQFPEKLIPLMIRRALSGETLPIYGDGMNVRDWLYVGDHCAAIRTVLEYGRRGETYNIGGSAERTNKQVVNWICELLDEMAPAASGISYKQQIAYVTDRPGHDRRYAVDTTKIQRELNWRPVWSFEEGMRRTVAWYLRNDDWMKSITSGDYLKWIATQYGQPVLA